MTQRKCSYCGEVYTDWSGHDGEKCLAMWKGSLHGAEVTLINARYDLEREYEKQIALLKEKLKAKEKEA